MSKGQNKHVYVVVFSQFATDKIIILRLIYDDHVKRSRMLAQHVAAWLMCDIAKPITMGLKPHLSPLHIA